jgi:signal transduction histidine kinase
MGQESRDLNHDPPMPDRSLPFQGPVPTVVAIDDDPSTLLLIARTLDQDGILCHTATTGAEGLRLIRAHQPDLVLLDIVMVGEDGFTICREIRRTWSPEQLPVVMVTGLEDLASIQAAYQAGANDFLVKPLHWKHLAYRIHHVLRANRAFKALQDSSKTLRTLFAVHPDSLFTLGTDDTVTLVHSGLRPAEPAALPPLGRLGELLPEPLAEQVRECRARALAAPAQVFSLEAAHALDGEPRFWEGRIIASGEAQVLVMVRDLTEARRTQDALRESRQRLVLAELERQRSEKLESLGSLAGGIAHDMNNVLAAIMGMASALRSTCADQDLRARPLDSILHASSRGRDLVKGLTDFASKGLDEPRWFDLNELLRKEVALLGQARLRQVQLVLDLDPGLPRVLGDASALGSTIMNLGINALDAMPEGGTLTFKSGALPDGRIELTVTDTGCGMAPDVLARAMEPFFTTKPMGKGTGLGLARVYGTARAHGGSLELQSQPGQGTCVRLLLPGGPGTPRTADPGPPAEAEPRALRVLLVDDDDLIQGSTQALLEVMGHTAVTVSSGEEALARLEAGYQPDIVLLDMNMPGLGGAGTLPRLRVLRPALPVLLATGRADQAALDLVHSYPKVTLLTKPFSLRELRQQLKTCGRR